MARKNMRRIPSIKNNLLLSLLLFVRPESTIAQPYERFELETKSAFKVSRGTLIIVVGNRHGFVIATDSRRTEDDGYRDDSQKLIRISDDSALAVAGFASALGTPFESEVVAELLKELPQRPNHSDGRRLRSSLTVSSNVGTTEADRTATWVKASLNWKFDLFSRIIQTEGMEVASLSFTALIADFDVRRSPYAVSISYRPQQQIWSMEHSVGPFIFVAHGMTQVFDQIKAGAYRGASDTLTNFQRRVQTGEAREMSLPELAQAALDLIAATAANDDRVGGPTQYGMFPADGKVIWQQQVFPEKRPVLPRIDFTYGGFNVLASNAAGVNGASAMMHTSDLVTGQVVVADSNVFVSSIFGNSIIWVQREGPLYWRKNTCVDSLLMRIPRPLRKLNTSCKTQ